LCSKGRIVTVFTKEVAVAFGFTRKMLGFEVLRPCKTASWLDSMGKHERRASVKVFKIVFCCQGGLLLKTPLFITDKLM